MDTKATIATHSNKQMKNASGVIEVPAGFTSSFTSIQGYEVHSLISDASDSRPGIVMIHGALASRRYLLPTARPLAKQFRVYVPEMPGHGASSRPKQALTVSEQAQVLAAWFSRHELKDVYVFANSYGCQVAAQLTATHPELVKRLILTGPTTDPAAPYVLAQGFRLWRDGFYEPKGSGKQLQADLKDMSLPIAFQTAHQMVSDDIRPKLAQIKCRTLVLRGANDPLAPLAWIQDIANRLSDSRLEVIENAPHCVNYATPGPLTEVILKFLAEQ